MTATKIHREQFSGGDVSNLATILRLVAVDAARNRLDMMVVNSVVKPLVNKGGGSVGAELVEPPIITAVPRDVDGVSAEEFNSTMRDLNYNTLAVAGHVNVVRHQLGLPMLATAGGAQPAAADTIELDPFLVAPSDAPNSACAHVMARVYGVMRVLARGLHEVATALGEDIRWRLPPGSSSARLIDELDLVIPASQDVPILPRLYMHGYTRDMRNNLATIIGTYNRIVIGVQAVSLAGEVGGENDHTFLRPVSSDLLPSGTADNKMLRTNFHDVADDLNANLYTLKTVTNTLLGQVGIDHIRGGSDDAGEDLILRPLDLSRIKPSTSKSRRSHADAGDTYDFAASFAHNAAVVGHQVNKLCAVHDEAEITVSTGSDVGVNDFMFLYWDKEKIRAENDHKPVRYERIIETFNDAAAVLTTLEYKLRSLMSEDQERPKPLSIVASGAV